MNEPSEQAELQTGSQGQQYTEAEWAAYWQYYGKFPNFTRDAASVIPAVQLL